MAPGADIQGRAFAPGSSAIIEAVLRVSDGSDQAHLIAAADQSVLAQGALGTLRIDPAPGNAARRIFLPDGWLFETEAENADLLLPRARGEGLLRMAERFHPRLILFALGCLAGVWLIWRYGLDVLVSVAIALTPPSVPGLIDQASLRSLDFAVADETRLSETQQQAGQEIFARMVAALPEADPDEFALHYRHMPGFGPNALAMPGGTIVLTDTLVRQFGNRPDVIAAVIGHEIGHVEENHSLRQLYRSLSVFVLIALMAGDVGPILEEALLEGQVLLSLSYSRAHEREADTFGLALTQAAGYDPAALKQFFEAVKKYDTQSDWYSTHPLSADRIDHVDDWLRAQNGS